MQGEMQRGVKDARGDARRDAGGDAGSAEEDTAYSTSPIMQLYTTSHLPSSGPAACQEPSMPSPDEISDEIRDEISDEIRQSVRDKGMRHARD